MASMNFADNLPPGFRFKPTAEELLLFYLWQKRNNESFSFKDIIDDLDLYGDKDPWTLFGVIDSSEEHCFYAFIDLKKNSENGKNIRRMAGSGTWSGKSGITQVKDRDGNVIGVDRYFIFMKKKKNGCSESDGKKEKEKGCSESDGKKKKEKGCSESHGNEHGKWTMHEFALVDEHGASMDDKVVCVIRCNMKKSIKHSVSLSKKRRMPSPQSDEEPSTKRTCRAPLPLPW